MDPSGGGKGKNMKNVSKQSIETKFSAKYLKRSLALDL
jgi:hypothetical protein